MYEKVLKCAMCKADIKGLYSANQDWGYKLGSAMRFCSYGCMRQKQALIDAKKKAFYEKKAQEKEAEQAAKKA